MATDPRQLMQLAQSLARSAPAQMQMPDYAGEVSGIQRDYALADALAGQSQNYIQDSGWLGALAQAVSGAMSYYKGKKADKAATDVSARMRADEERISQAERDEKAKERQANIERLAAAYKITPEQAGVVADGLGKAKDFEPPKADKPEVFKVGNQLVQVGPDGQPKVLHSAPRAVAQAARPMADFEAYLSLSPEQRAAYDKFKGRGEDGAKPLSAKDQVAAANRSAASESLLSSIGAAEKMLQDGEVSTGPIAGRATSWTANAQKYQAEIGGILSELRRLQKTPGSGADSDRELALLLNQVPSMLTDESAALEILGRLREKASIYASAGHPQIIPNSSLSQQGGWGIEEIK